MGGPALGLWTHRGCYTRREDDAHRRRCRRLPPPNCRPAATDPFSPNCKGQNYSCLTTQTQYAFGQAPADAATFNDFGMPNVGFCKMQQKHSPGRSHTLGPQLMQTGRVFGGVGLSQAQFGIGADSPKSQAGDGGVSCGMCLEVTAKMALWDCELTKPVNLHNQSLWPEQKLIVMVMDQCKDEWTEWSADGTTAAGNCNTGHLDFDVYPTDHSVSFLGVKNLTWRAWTARGQLPVRCSDGQRAHEQVFVRSARGTSRCR